MCHWRGAILQSFLFFSMILVFCFNLHYVIFTYFTLIRSIYIYILGDGPIVWRPNSLKVRYSEDPIVRRSDSLKARKSEDLLAWNQNRIFIFFYSDWSSINGLHPFFKHFQWIVFEYHDFSETHLVYWTFGLSDYQVFGPLGFRTIWPSDYRADTIYCIYIAMKNCDFINKHWVWSKEGVFKKMTIGIYM
jgi:hypothetical protein